MAERAPHVESSFPARDVPPHPAQPWDNGRWGVQTWLERTAWRTLRDTQFGHSGDNSRVHPALHDDPLLRKVYLIDVALFISAEQVSYNAVAGMVRLAPDELSQVQLGTQVLDECRHFEAFCRRLADFGVGPEKRQQLVQRHTTPKMRTFYDLILEQVDRRDFFASSIAQNLILEGMAYPLYRYEIKYWSRFDPNLTQLIRGAFADESHHVGFGEAINAAYYGKAAPGERERIQRLVKDFHVLMKEVFEEVIRHYVGLYQECANNYMDLMGDLEIFPGRRLGQLTEEDQIRLVLAEIEEEHRTRLARMGIT